MDCSEAGRLTHPLDPPAVGGEGVTRCRDLAEEKSQEGSWPTKRRGTAHTFSTCDAISCSVPARVIFSLPPLFARVQLAPLAPRLSLLGSPRPVCGTGGLPARWRRGRGEAVPRDTPRAHPSLAGTGPPSPKDRIRNCPKRTRRTKEKMVPGRLYHPQNRAPAVGGVSRG